MSCRITNLLIASLAILYAMRANADPTCTDSGDRNGDCRIDEIDYGALADCFSGPGTAADLRCVCFDTDGDDDVDLQDFRGFQSSYSGEQLLAGCDMMPAEFEPASMNTPPAAETMRPVMIREILKSNFETGDKPTQVQGFSGEFIHTGEDLRIPGRGPDFVWSRKYRSKVGPSTAMGAGWDFSYNVYLEADGDDLILHDGNSRHDRYFLVSGAAGNVWCAKDFFREITEEPTGEYVCTFPTRDVWRFHDLDGSPQEGRLSQIVDTNSNALSFTYDPVGRLTTVTDSLSRPISIDYNSNGFVSSVTDFTGRRVTYDYYTDLDSNGASGDLKSVTSPVVTGTPNGNDFSNGKTTVYTYSTGSSDERLNHNLLSITDPKGQTYLTSEYSATTNGLDFDYDRVSRQVLGEPGDIIDYVYDRPSPTASNGYAVTHTIVNNRNGHVTELLYDKFNRCVVQRAYTGQANPDLPTSSSSNRPTGALRPTDPGFYESRITYNGDSLPSSVVDPEGSVCLYQYEGDVTYLSSARDKTNILRVRCQAGPRGGDQQALVETYEYDSQLNGDTNQVTRCVDRRGNEVRHEYDARGNRTSTQYQIPSIEETFEYNSFGQLTAEVHPDNGSGHHRRDELTYYSSGPQNGYLHESVVDAPGLALTTEYEYDAVGNVTRIIDPRGNDSLYVYNQLDQPVRSLSRSANPPSMPRFATDFYYDENDNVVRVDVENRDENGAPAANSHFTTLYDYDILNRLTQTTEEVDPADDVVTEYEYDAEGNRTLTRSGEATNGAQPTNTVTVLYDERDLLFREVRAAGDPKQSTTQYDYDGNANVVRSEQGQEAAVTGGTPRVTVYVYDGYDRRTRQTDPLGNTTQYEYDANDNCVTFRVDGEVDDVPGDAGNVRLLERVYDYDAVDRCTDVDESFFVVSTQAPIDDGLSSISTIYSDNSQVLSVTDDNSHTTTYAYDSVNRVSQVTDDVGNSVVHTYDENSNVLTTTETELSGLGLPNQVFVTTFTYDGLDRLSSHTDSAGNQVTYAYDSRDNRVATNDALNNETRYEYDGLSRKTSTTVDLDGDGADGDGADVVTIHVWDDNSRLIQTTDDNGHTTVTGHDPLNRPAFKNFADGTSETFEYDVHDNLVSREDPNGCVIDHDYDELDRRIHTTVTIVPGVSNATTFETFTYDGVSRVRSAQDDDDVVTFSYDSLSSPVTESLNGQSTSSTFDGVGNLLDCVYPSGKQVNYVYDALDRMSSISVGTNSIASYVYVGPGRLELRQLSNGTRTLFTYDGIQGAPNPPGDFGVKQIVALNHTGPAASQIDTRTFEWSPVYDKTRRVDTRTSGPRFSHIYQYDSLYRLTNTLVEDSMGTPRRVSNYDLDGVGNRLAITGFGGITGPYVMDPTMPQPADFQVNQYTQTPRDNRQYDDNGNLRMIASPVSVKNTQYDCADRLVNVSDPGTGDSCNFQYDPLGRRVRKLFLPGGGGPPIETRYFYGPMTDVIEEQDSSSSTLAEYVRGARSSDIVCVESGGQIVYHHCDDVGNVMALTDTNGTVVERYEYDDYGAVQMCDGAGLPIPSSLVGNQYLFMGMRRDPETGWYEDRANYLDPEVGRFVVRQQFGPNQGNRYAFAGDNPWSNGGTCGHGDNGELRVRVVAKMIAAGGGGNGNGDLPKVIIKSQKLHGGMYGGGHVTVLKMCGRGQKERAEAEEAWEDARGIAGGGYDGHVTVLKARGGHHGHVTVLKMCGHGPKEYNEARKATGIAGGGYDGHVTVLKARGGHHGHVTVLKARGGGNGNGEIKIIVNGKKLHGGTNGGGLEEVKVIIAGKKLHGGGHHGHVTVLKAHGGLRAAGTCKICGKYHSIPQGSTGFYCSWCKGCCRVGGAHKQVWKSRGGGGSGSGVFGLGLVSSTGAGMFAGDQASRAWSCKTCGKSANECEGHILPASNNINKR